MRVTTLAHASVLIEVGADRILVDPIFDDVFASGTLCLHPARDVDADTLLATVTALVVTHIHLDHFHAPTLQRFPRHLPVIVPAHDALVSAIERLGFSEVIALAPWTRHALARGCLLATPSDFEMEEFGLVALDGADSYWHMSDAIVTVDVGERVLREVGPVSLASVKFQPLRTLIAWQRGLASTMLDRDDLCASFEAACAAEPACLFPYYAGFAFHGAHAWANRYISPYRAVEIANLLRRRLGDKTNVVTVTPGDTFDIAARTVRHVAGGNACATPRAGPAVQSWEPIDVTSLPGVDTLNDQVWLTLAVERLLTEEVLPWVQAHLDHGSGWFDTYRQLDAVWQCVVHVGDGRRLHHVIDFRAARATLLGDCLHPAANVFSHIAGGLLLQVLRGQAGAEVFWMAGGYRIYEKILYLHEGRIAAPAHNGWDLYEHLPDPLTHYLRRVSRSVQGE